MYIRHTDIHNNIFLNVCIKLDHKICALTIFLIIVPKVPVMINDKRLRPSNYISHMSTNFYMINL